MSFLCHKPDCQSFCVISNIWRMVSDVWRVLGDVWRLANSVWRVISEVLPSASMWGVEVTSIIAGKQISLLINLSLLLCHLASVAAISTIALLSCFCLLHGWILRMEGLVLALLKKFPLWVLYIHFSVWKQDIQVKTSSSLMSLPKRTMVLMAKCPFLESNVLYDTGTL